MVLIVALVSFRVLELKEDIGSKDCLRLWEVVVVSVYLGRKVVSRDKNGR